MRHFDISGWPLKYQIKFLMQNFYKFLFLLLAATCFQVNAFAQIPQGFPDTTRPTSIDVNLENLFSQKVPQRYKVANIIVTGNKFFDQALLISIANINIGDEIMIPGGDQFARAISNLWKQNYFSNVEVYVTKVESKNIYLEIEVTERPRLASFIFKGNAIRVYKPSLT